MTTKTIEQIYTHFSVRKYKPDSVPVEFVENIVMAGQRASTSSNLQMYSVVVVTESRKRKRLSELCGNQNFIYQAPVFMVWCADLSRLRRICQLRGYHHKSENVENFLLAAIDVTLCMQNAALAAESLGLGMCYVGAIRNNPRDVIGLLEVPELVFPLVGMTLGWPDIEPNLKPRLPLGAVLHWETYNTQGEVEALADYDQQMISSGINKGRQVSVPGVEDEIEEYGWMEHTARRVSKPIRPHLREVLREQGFALE
jgi:FMN reductase (NADPH)